MASTLGVLGFGAVATATQASADDCPAGQVADGFTGECILDMEPIAFLAPQGITIHVGPTYSGSVNGIPCTPEHYGTCYGMSQNQPTYHQPHSTVSHSP